MKGQTNNPNGRPKGIPNKVNKDLKSRIAQIVENGFETVEADLKALEAKDRINTYLKLLEYIIPKQRETKIDIGSLSDAEVEALLNKAIETLK
ncbi:MAG: hypothetical protein U0X91_20570 [Spirosomataceae bacterium]